MSKYVDIDQIIESTYVKWGGDPAYYVNDTPTGYEARRDAELIEMLRGEPSVDIAQFKWHKYPDEKPPECGDYLVCYEGVIGILYWGRSYAPQYRHIEEYCWYDEDPVDGTFLYSDVYAWMPLPEPMPMEKKR